MESSENPGSSSESRRNFNLLGCQFHNCQIFKFVERNGRSPRTDLCEHCPPAAHCKIFPLKGASRHHFLRTEHTVRTALYCHRHFFETEHVSRTSVLFHRHVESSCFNTPFPPMAPPRTPVSMFGRIAPKLEGEVNQPPESTSTVSTGINAIPGLAESVDPKGPTYERYFIL